jgi:hypothetical protein
MQFLIENRKEEAFLNFMRPVLLWDQDWLKMMQNNSIYQYFLGKKLNKILANWI